MSESKKPPHIRAKLIGDFVFPDFRSSFSDVVVVLISQASDAEIAPKASKFKMPPELELIIKSPFGSATVNSPVEVNSQVSPVSKFPVIPISCFRETVTGDEKVKVAVPP